MTWLWVLWLPWMAFLVTAMIRNNWVHRQRMGLINAFYHPPGGTDEWWERTKGGANWDDDYLSYDGMLWRFWVWDVEKLRKPGR